MRLARDVGNDFFQKLGLKPGQRVGLVRAPPAWVQAFRQTFTGPSAPNSRNAVVAWASVAKAGKADVILAWLAPRDNLRETFDALAARIPPNGAIWTVIPKRSALAKGEVAVTWMAMQAAGLASGRLVDNKELRFDDRYYGTRFVVRKDQR